MWIAGTPVGCWPDFSITTAACLTSSSDRHAAGCPWRTRGRAMGLNAPLDVFLLRKLDAPGG